MVVPRPTFGTVALGASVVYFLLDITDPKRRYGQLSAGLLEVISSLSETLSSPLVALEEEDKEMRAVLDVIIHQYAPTSISSENERCLFGKPSYVRRCWAASGWVGDHFR